MQSSFSSYDFVNELAKELVNGFRKAGMATTPVLVGSAREKEVRKKLEQLFAQTIGISTGCIIDTHGRTSKQTDIILYEKDICPVFSINENPESTYFPCEGVIAVGEIKSTLDKRDLQDSFAKIKSAKQCMRIINEKVCWRSYCSRLIIQGSDVQYYNQQEKALDQMFGFILCEKIGLKLDTFLSLCGEMIAKESAYLLPNIIVSLHDGLFVYLDTNAAAIKDDKAGADAIYNVRNGDGDFQFMLNRINYFINNGRTSDIIPFERYILKSNSISPNGKIQKI
jgi:hypothetical protein